MTNTTGGFLTTPCSCGGANENCFKCGGWGFIDKIGLGRGTPTLHGIGSQFVPAQHNTPKRTRGSSALQMFQCPHCSVKVPKLQKHINKIHGSGIKPALISTPKSKEMVKCDQCISWVRQDRLNAHSLKVHRRTHGAQETPRAVITKKPIISLHRTRTANAVVPPSNDRQLDATRDYYSAYRENGRFGSHPSHDAFDDESMP